PIPIESENDSVSTFPLKISISFSTELAAKISNSSTVRLPEEKIIIICPGKRNPHLNRNL
ncbi:unnamed protein product, partial [marine sediment metagenome]